MVGSLMRQRRNYKFVGLFLWICLFQFSVEAKEVSPGGSEKRHEVIAVFPARFPPIYNINVNNMPTGFGIDVMEAVAARADVRVRYVPVDSWEEAFDKLESGEADIIPNLGITRSRERFAQFTRPINQIPVSLLVLSHRSDYPFTKLSELRGTQYLVGVVKNNVGVKVLDEEPDIISKKYPHLADALLDLATEKIDAIVYPEPVARYVARNLRLKGHLQVLGKPLREIPRAIAISKKNNTLSENLDKALSQFLKSDEYQEIYRRWHPEPVFWSHQRVAILFGVLGLLVISGFAYFRFRVLRRVNNDLKESNAFISAVLDISAEGIFTLNRSGVILTANLAAEEIFGRDKSSLVGSRLARFMPQIEASQFTKRLESYSREDREEDQRIKDKFREYRVKSREGRLFPVRIALETTLVNEVEYFICTIQDVSQLREAQNLADFYINHDPLTGLVNQSGFTALLKGLLAQSKRHNRSLSCLHIDIDRMHAINDAYGYATGDDVLVQFVRRLDGVIRQSDLVGKYDDNILVRSGGNRFVVVLPETDVAGATKAANRIAREIEGQPLIVNKDKINATCKFGIAVYPEHGATPIELLSHSEAALRVAKSSGRTLMHIYEKSDGDGEKKTEAWIERIISGIRDNRFFLLFQPIFDIKKGEVHHFEALVRYQDDHNKIVLPGEFIPVAEQYGSIKQIDRRVMQLAISYLAGLEAAGLNFSISINLSGANIGDPDLFGWLEHLFEENELDPNHLIFEITETASLQSITSARSFIDSIKALGCQIALDDFGVGLSSFSYLRNFPVDILKIDGSFIKNLPNSEEDRVMVKSMVDVAHSLGKQVVAEFVSSKEILDIISEFGVDYAQGFYISKPVNLEKYIKNHKDDKRYENIRRER